MHETISKEDFKFNEWELLSIPNSYWKEEPTVIEAIKWLVEEKLKWDDIDMMRKLNIEVFNDNRLMRMLKYVYNYSPYEAINSAYPNKFKPWQFDKIWQFKKNPRNYWSVDTGIEAIRWLIDEKLRWNEETILNSLNKKFLRKNKLGDMVNIIFNGSELEAINSAYPNKFKPWKLTDVSNDSCNLEINKTIMAEDKSLIKYYKGVLSGDIKAFYNGFWIGEDGKNNADVLIKWLIEEKLRWSNEDIEKKLDNKTFRENCLESMLKIVFESSPYLAINTTYPGKFKPWQMKGMPRYFWTKETGGESMKWLINEKLKWSDADIEKNISQKTFKNNGLEGMLNQIFDGSIHKALNSIYPDRYKPWEFCILSKDCWTLEMGINATKWLFEEKLRWDDEDIKENLSYKVFRENGLANMLLAIFNNTPYQAINLTYEDKFKPWEFKRVANGYWTEETSILATKWLFDKKLKLLNDNIKESACRKIFKENRLSGMLFTSYNHSALKALKSAYPNKFKNIT